MSSGQDFAIDVHGVAHDGRRDAHDLAVVVGHHDVDPFGLAVVGALIDPTRTGDQWQVGVVDRGDEVGGVDLGVIVTAVARVDHEPGRTLGGGVAVGRGGVVISARGHRRDADGQSQGQGDRPGQTGRLVVHDAPPRSGVVPLMMCCGG